MKIDEIIEVTTKKIAESAKTWIDMVTTCGNQNAHTDAIIEEIIRNSDKLKKLYWGN